MRGSAVWLQPSPPPQSLPPAKGGGFCAAKRGGIVSARPKPPLCKGRWHGVSRDGGIVPAIILHDLQIDRFTIQSLRCYATAPFAGGSLFMFDTTRQLPMKPRSGFSHGHLLSGTPRQIQNRICTVVPSPSLLKRDTCAP